MELFVPDSLRPLSAHELSELAKKTVHDDFSRLQPAWAERQLAILCSLRKCFGNDIDKPIILGVIGQVMFAQRDAVDYDYTTALTAPAGNGRKGLTNIESIALATGIPRESVRRKVGELVAAGWVERDAKGRLLVTAEAVRGLDGTSQHVFVLLADMFTRIARAMARGGAAEVMGVRRDAGEPAGGAVDGAAGRAGSRTLDAAAETQLG